MTFKTNYRDIPFDEVLKCAPSTDSPEHRKLWENRMRGQAVAIAIPAVNEKCAKAQYEVFICGGPFYRRTLSLTPNAAVCVHIVEAPGVECSS